MKVQFLSIILLTTLLPVFANPIVTSLIDKKITLLANQRLKDGCKHGAIPAAEFAKWSELAYAAIIKSTKNNLAELELRLNDLSKITRETEDSYYDFLDEEELKVVESIDKDDSEFFIKQMTKSVTSSFYTGARVAFGMASLKGMENASKGIPSSESRYRREISSECFFKLKD